MRGRSLGDPGGRAWNKWFPAAAAAETPRRQLSRGEEGDDSGERKERLGTVCALRAPLLAGPGLGVLSARCGSSPRRRLIRGRRALGSGLPLGAAARWLPLPQLGEARARGSWARLGAPHASPGARTSAPAGRRPTCVGAPHRTRPQPARPGLQPLLKSGSTFAAASPAPRALTVLSPPPDAPRAPPRAPPRRAAPRLPRAPGPRPGAARSDPAAAPPHPGPAGSAPPQRPQSPAGHAGHEYFRAGEARLPFLCRCHGTGCCGNSTNPPKAPRGTTRKRPHCGAGAQSRRADLRPSKVG